jgi:hypothetical protein
MIQDYYTDIEVFRLNESTNSFGGVVKTWVFRNVIQGLINNTGPEKQSYIANQYQVSEPYNFYCNLDGGLGWTNSQIAWIDAGIPWEGWGDDEKVVMQGDRLRWNGQVYRVVSNSKNTVNRDHHLKFILERLDSDVQEL